MPAKRQTAAEAGAEAPEITKPEAPVTPVAPAAPEDEKDLAVKAVGADAPESADTKEVKTVKAVKAVVLDKANDEDASLAKAVEKKVKLIRVKFLEKHSFNMGIQKYNASVGQVLEVEPHLANKLLSRKIAYILS